MINIKNKDKSFLDYFYKFGLYIVFVVVIAIFSILNPKFFAIENFINIFLQSSAIGIAAVGVAFVILTAGIDISVGSIMFLSATITAHFVGQGAGLFITILIALLCGSVIGAINGFVVARFRIVPFIATLASMFYVRGIALIISEQKMVFFTGEVGMILAKTRLLGIPLIVLIFLAVLTIGQLVLSKTSYGRQIYAIGSNPAAAQKMGLKVRKLKFSVYLISGIMAGLSGLIASVQVGAVIPTFGKGSEFVVISSVVLGGVSLFGGKGNIFPGVLVGVLLVMSIENGLVLVGANPYLYQIVRGVIIFVAVMLDCVRFKGELR